MRNGTLHFSLSKLGMPLMVQKRLPLWLLMVAAILCFSGSVVQGASPNIVLIVADDLGFQLGCYGNPVIKTPHIDALAKRGTRFTNAYCTTASCSSSRSVILSGLHNHANGQLGLEHAVHHFSALNKVKGVAGLLEARGYRTANTGKFHVAPASVFQFGETIKADARSPVAMAGACEEFIKRDGDKPFFLYYCTVDPHRSGAPNSKGYADITTPPLGTEELPVGPVKRPTSASELFIDRFGNHNHENASAKKYSPADVLVPSFLPDTETCRRELAEYYQSISRLDDGVGRLIEVLKDSGKLDNTLILFTSDNGPPWPNAKTTQYNSGIHLPLIAVYPGQTEGRVCQAMVTHADITPTLLDFAGGAKPKIEFHGKSWKEAATQESPAGWDEVYHSHTFHEVTMYYPMRTVQNRKYKLIWNLASGEPYPFASDLYESATWQETLLRDRANSTKGSTLYGNRTVKQYTVRPAWELYDLQADPGESQNLADQPQHAALLKEMQQKIREFQVRTGDPWAIKWEHP